MKSIECLTAIRHGESTYNKHRLVLKESSSYKNFLNSLSTGDYDGVEVIKNALSLMDLNKDFVINEEVPLSEAGWLQAQKTGANLKNIINLPDVIYVSPSKRTMETLSGITAGWPDLKVVQTLEDSRLIEQKHGLFTNFGDWNLFCFYHPEERLRRQENGVFDYRYPEGESIKDVQIRTKTLLEEISNHWRGRQVLLVSHNVTILAIMANIEDLNPEQLIEQIKKKDSINCGVTVYREGNKKDIVNKKLY